MIAMSACNRVSRVTCLLLISGMISGGQPRQSPPVVTLCRLSRDYGAYRDRQLAVRGVYYYNLREACPMTCATGPWPSFLYLSGGDDSVWEALTKTERAVETEAKKGKRFEILVTVHGRLKTRARRSPSSPCDRMGSGYYGYGHLGAYPAELAVDSFSDIQVIENRNSPYDYANMYRGPW
jgi:hypothetical protein